MNAEQIARALDGSKPSGDGWAARCPVHEDKRASLTLRDGDRGVLGKCHAGCERSVVIDELKARGLWRVNGSAGKARQIVETYQYVNEAGVLLFEVVRYDEPKDFVQRAPDGAGGWKWSTKGVRRVLYRLPALLAADPDALVFVAEGERDVHALERAGLLATTNPGGAGKWRKEHSEVLRGRRVVILPDNDDPGRDHGEQVARSLHGIAREVRIVTLPGLGAKQDVRDWLGAGHTADALLELVAAAPLLEQRDTRSQPAAPSDNGPIATCSEPIDLFADHALPALPLSAVPSVIADFAADRADLIGCDPAAIIVPALVTCGAVLPDQITIQPKAHDRTWREAGRLWAFVVGPPAAKKSPALKAAGAPAFAINAKLAESNAAEMREYDEAVTQAKKAKQTLPPRPAWRQLLVQDTTIEALSDALLDNPRGVLMLADELSEWIGGMDAYTAGRVQKDRPGWLQAFEGGPRSLNRVMRGRAVIPNWSTAIAGGIQPDVVRRLFSTGTGTSDGLTQRFLAVTLAPAGIGADRPDDDAAASAYKALVRSLWEVHDEPSTATLAPDAHGALREYLTHIHGVADSLAGSAEAFASHLGKWPGILARLALVYHAIDCAGRSRHPSADPVSLATIEAVITLARDYLFPHAAHFYGEVLQQRTHHATAVRVADIILAQHWQAFTSRDVAAQWKGWRALDERYQGAVLTYLSLAGWINEAEPEPRPGRRPSDLFAVNPAVHARFEAQAIQVRARRAQLRADWQAATHA